MRADWSELDSTRGRAASGIARDEGLRMFDAYADEFAEFVERIANRFQFCQLQRQDLIELSLIFLLGHRKTASNR